MEDIEEMFNDCIDKMSKSKSIKKIIDLVVWEKLNAENYYDCANLRNYVAENCRETLGAERSKLRTKMELEDVIRYFDENIDAIDGYEKACASLFFVLYVCKSGKKELLIKQNQIGQFICNLINVMYNSSYLHIKMATCQLIVTESAKKNLIMGSNLSSVLTELNILSDMCYRGHSKLNYILKPSLLRVNLIEHEEMLIQDAINRLPQYFEGCKNEIDKLVIMQHYGLPTRLLDVTHNPLVALFFVVVNNLQDAGVLLCFEVCDDYFIYGNDDSINQEFSNIKIANTIKCIRPKYNNERIINQRGFFFLCNNDCVDSINKLVKKIIVIPSENKEKIKEELRGLGIDEGFIYPDIEHIMTAIAEKYKNLG